MKILVVLFAVLAATAPIANDAPENFASIQTTSGKVVGHNARWPENSNVEEYLGIPYAASPVGSLRFKAPRPYKPKDDPTIKADDFMDACMQPAQGAENLLSLADPALLSYAVGMGGLPGRKYSENCLGLNIWTKKNNTGPPKAVLVWIYGGGFAAGDTAAPYYNGARFATEQDVVVASIGYRLNVFGFPGAPGLEDYNLGLLDQRLAVEWLRDNIEKFGGDPKRMTLFGESAGGMSVDTYAYAWTKDPIVNGFIAQSGTAFLGKKHMPNNPSWFQVSKNAGCGGAEAGENTVKCMQRLPANIVMKAMGEGISGIGTAMSSFGPTVDEKVVFSNYKSRAAAGLFIQKPLLAGLTDNEAGIMSAMVMGAMKSAAKSNSLPGIISEIAGYIQATLDALRYSSPVATLGAVISPYIDSAFNCPTRDAVDARFKLKVPVWRYRFMAVFPNSQIYPDTGAYHSIDCPTVFGTTGRNVQKMPNTLEQDKFVTNVMTAWAAFAKDPENGLQALGWPKYNPESQSLVRLGWKNQAQNTFAMNSEYDSTCNTVNQLGMLFG